MRHIGVIVTAVWVLAISGCMPAEPVTPTFYEIFPLPNTAEPSATASVTPDVTVTLAHTPVSGNAPDLVAFVRTSVAPPTCFDQHSRAGALVTVQNQGLGDAGAFAVDVDGVRQTVWKGLKAGESIVLFARPATLAEIRRVFGS